MVGTRYLWVWVVAWCCLPAHAQWQWTDAAGRQVFSDRAPPPEIADKNIIKRPAISPPKNALLQSLEVLGQGDTPSAAAGASVGAVPGVAAGVPAPTSTPLAVPAIPTLDKALEAKRQQAAQAQAAADKAAQERSLKAKIENCARAKQAKATFDSGVRLARTNTVGETEVLDEAARAAEQKRIQSVMDSDCR
jgi:hypothetical protein